MSGWPTAPKDTRPDNVGTELIAGSSDVAEEPAPKASQRLRLSSLADVKRQIRLVYIEARNGEMATGEATRFVYILTQLANLIADADLERKVSRLEGERD